MKVLILGGTGAIGIHLVNLLAQEDKTKTFITTRGDSPSEGNIQYIKGNAHNTDFLKQILAKHYDVIVDFMVYDTACFKERVNLLLAATNQYIFLSSSRVYAESINPIHETSPRLLDVCTDTAYLSTDEYALTKARQENILKNSSYKNWTIIRPYITYSDIRLQLGILEKEGWLYRALRGRSIVFSHEIASKVTTVTFGYDVAKGIKAVMGKTDALSETFHITGQDFMLWKDILSLYIDVLEKYLGSKPTVLFCNLTDFEKCHPAKFQIKYDRLFNRTFDNTAISHFINQSEFIKIKDGLTTCLEQFLTKQEFRCIDWRSEACKDRLTKENTPLSEINGLKQKIKYLLFRYFAA